MQGVHPIEIAIPIKKEPIYPVGRFLNVTFRCFIKNSKLKKRITTRPKKIITIAPICLMNDLFASKNCETKFMEKPRIIKMTEKPSKKITVCERLFVVNVL